MLEKGVLLTCILISLSFSSATNLKIPDGKKIILWDKTIGGTPNPGSPEDRWGGDRLKQIIAADGGYLLAGQSSSNINGDKSELSRGPNDYWIVKINAQGKKQTISLGRDMIIINVSKRCPCNIGEHAPIEKAA